jgi:hypothetical protein
VELWSVAIVRSVRRPTIAVRASAAVAVVNGRHEDTEPDSSRRDRERAEDRPAVRIPGRVVTPDVGVKPPGFEAVDVGQHIGPVTPDEIVDREAHATLPVGNPRMPCPNPRLNDMSAHQAILLRSTPPGFEITWPRRWSFTGT